MTDDLREAIEATVQEIRETLLEAADFRLLVEADDPRLPEVERDLAELQRKYDLLQLYLDVDDFERGERP
jgi:hypothetical protein